MGTRMDLEKKPLFSVLIPAYNESKSIGLVLKKLMEMRDRYSFEIIVINDCSEDDTALVVKEYSDVKLIDQPYNKGYGAALKAGARKATTDFILTMDADGQHKAEQIPGLIEYIPDFDMVIGARREQIGFIRLPGKWILTKVANYLSGFKIPDLNSGFRLIRKSCLDEFEYLLPNGFSFSTTITLAMLKSAYNIKYIPINTNARLSGNSRVNIVRDGAITILLIIRCISLFNPMKVYMPIALVLIIIGLLYGAIGIYMNMSLPKTSVLIILSGIMLMFLGILSDQLSMLWRKKS